MRPCAPFKQRLEQSIAMDAQEPAAEKDEPSAETDLSHGDEMQHGAQDQKVPEPATALATTSQARLRRSGYGGEPGREPGDDVQVFIGEWDDEGVFVYQAYNDAIADWGVEHQRLGGPHFLPSRMTWIKPSFAWVLYRSGYGRKPGQNRVLKVKLSHQSLGDLLSQCKVVDTNKATRNSHKESQSDLSNGRVQWDPERDLFSADGKEPRKLLRRRAIQIGLAGKLSELYVQSIISIQDVTDLAHKVCEAHRSKKKDAMQTLLEELPDERPYMPSCSDHRLQELGMLPGEAASAIARIGRGKAS
eukprot:TRINITY_DN36355_c0_g1_i1.p1 TRINITY_DN36355_c0_g1~~TRINITY_DN36355_c0_g1_i1.p1  ORF type:complete len:303 (+),score=60.26 TRINITY_DN36355_c0_g1_i1:13-921(+)